MVQLIKRAFCIVLVRTTYCTSSHYNVYTCTMQVQVLIPVRGSKTTGQVRSIATVRNGKWELDTVVLEFKGRPEKLVIIDNDKNANTNTTKSL